MGFADIRDQPIAVKLLQQAIQKQRLPTAMLFSGPDGVGKMRTALEVAKAVNCERGGGDACDVCLSCRKINNGTHSDLRCVTPTGHLHANRAMDIFNVAEDVNYQPFEGRYLVYILDDVERMHRWALAVLRNAMEEPKIPVLFLLLTTCPRALHPTIRSRCQRVHFKPLPDETIVQLLQEERGLILASAQYYAGLSSGQMTQAEFLLDTDYRQEAWDLLKALRTGLDPLQAAQDIARESAERRWVHYEVMDTFIHQNPDDPLDRRYRPWGVKASINAYIRSATHLEMHYFLKICAMLIRDELVYSITQDAAHIVHNDLIPEFQPTDRETATQKLLAIEIAFLQLNKHLKFERILRDLFFTLAGADSHPCDNTDTTAETLKKLGECGVPR